MTVPSLIARLRQRILDEWNNDVSRSGVYLLMNTAVTGAMGMVYWVLAARLYPQASVGAAAALVSSATLLSALGQMNLSGMLMRFLPLAESKSRSLVLITYAFATLSTLALTVVGAILIAIVAPDSSVLHLSPTLAALFAVSAMATVIFTLQDSVLLASRKAAWIPFENGVFGAAKIGLLLLFASIATSGAIFASWMLPLAAIVPVVSIFLFRKVLPRQAPGQAAEPVTAETKSNIRKFVSGDAASGMLAQGGIYLLPVLVTVTLGASVNAIFYAAFMLTLTLDLIASNFSAAFVVEGTHSGGPVGALFLSTARKVYAILLPAVAFVIVFAPSIMSIYGPQYEAGASTLRLLALACLPKAILSLFFGFCRIARKTHFSAMCQAVGFIGVLGGAVLGSSRGVTAIALVILVVQCVIVIAILPVMTRMIKDRSIRTKLDFEPTFEDALASEGSAKA